MKKFVSHIAISLIVISIFTLQSCVDEAYDLTQENISLEVNVGGKNLAIPIGSTDSILLGNLVGENELIGFNSDSIYSLNMSSTIDPINLSFDPISLNIGSVAIAPLSLDFGSTSVGDFALAAMNNSSTIEVPEADLSDIELPSIVTNYEHVDDLGTPIAIAGLPIKRTINVPEKTIDINFNYDLNTNEQVDGLNIVHFGETDEGTRFIMAIDFSNINRVVNKDKTTETIVQLDIEFPSDFELALDPSSTCSSSATVVDSKFSINNCDLTTDNDIHEISFFIKNLTLNETGNVNYTKQVKYSMSINIDGESNGEEVSELKVEINSNTDLTLNHADVTTSDLPIEGFTGSFSMNSSIEDLEDISAIGLIEFKPSSILNLKVNNPGLPFEFISGNLKIDFPALLSFDIANSVLGDATLSENTLTIPAENLFGADISLVIKSADLTNNSIVDGKLNLDELVEYRTENLVLGSEDISTLELNGLGTKTIDILVPETTLSIESATVTTNSITASIEQSSTIEISEEVPTEINSIQSIALFDANGSKVTIAINFENVPEGLGNLTFKKFKITLPTFIQFAPEDNVVDGVLTLNDSFNPTNGFSKTLTIIGIDFTGAFGADGITTQMVAEKNMMIIDSNNTISLKGNVKTAESTLNSDDLDGLSIIPSFTIEPISVGEVIGIFDPSIDPIDQTVALDFGESLDFLKEANIKFNNPQIMLTINSNIGIPIDIALGLQGKDLAGNTIEGSQIDEVDIKIKAAETPGETTASKFILSELGTELEGYESVQIEGISKLLQILPDMISFQLDATSDKTEPHTVDLSKELTISGDYQIAVPLQFDEFEINFDTIISGMGDSLADVIDLVGDAGIIIAATVENSIPLAFSMEITPIDIDGNPIEGLEASLSDTISAGNGIVAAEKDIQIRLSSTNNALTYFDGLKLHFNISATETVNGVGLKNDQFLRLKDIAIIIEDGINVDLKDLLNE